MADHKLLRSGADEMGGGVAGIVRVLFDGKLGIEAAAFLPGRIVCLQDGKDRIRSKAVRFGRADNVRTGLDGHGGDVRMARFLIDGGSAADFRHRVARGEDVEGEQLERGLGGRRSAGHGGKQRGENGGEAAVKTLGRSGPWLGRWSIS